MSQPFASPDRTDDQLADDAEHGVRHDAVATGPDDDGSALPAPDVERRPVLRVPRFSLLATILGWLAAWGAIAVATAILQRTDVPTGLNFGIAEGGPGDDGFWPGVWLAVVVAGGFLLGGYTAARLARSRGTRHAVVMWIIAMAATLADALVEWGRDGEQGVIRLIPGVPFWGETGLEGSDGEIVLVLGILAAAALAGALIGGALGQGVNKVERTDDAIVQRVD